MEHFEIHACLRKEYYLTMHSWNYTANRADVKASNVSSMACAQAS
jgi:hypothetical protein